jgi:hypothetical protein
LHHILILLLLHLLHLLPAILLPLYLPLIFSGEIKDR